MSAFVLKVIALISMACDHSSYVLFGHFSFLNYIGRMAFPIFAFQISEGYIYTKNLKNYLLRLFTFALISQAPFMLFTSMYSSQFSLNIFFTLFLGLFAVTVFDMLYKLDYKNKGMHYLYILIGFIFVVLTAIMSNVFHCDYGYYGITIIFIFYLLKEHKILMNLAFIICTVLYYLRNLLYSSNFEIYLWIIVFTCLPLVFINLYNNKKGKDTKYFLYLFYPIHLLILWGINLLFVL